MHLFLVYRMCLDEPCHGHLLKQAKIGCAEPTHALLNCLRNTGLVSGLSSFRGLKLESSTVRPCFINASSTGAERIKYRNTAWQCHGTEQLITDWAYIKCSFGKHVSKF